MPGGRGTRILPLETFRRFKSGPIFQCFPGAVFTELMTSASIGSGVEFYPQG